MLFNSAEFLVFAVCVFALYWFVFNTALRWQNALIVAASYLFYGWWDWRFLSLIALSTLIDYGCGIAISSTNNQRTKKAWLWLSMCFNLGLLGFFKYFNFFIESFVELSTAAGFTANATSLSIILPVGISFYTFQTMSYTIDVYRGKLSATKDLVAFTAYVSFFPQLVAGPIERAAAFLPQFFKSRQFNYFIAIQGLQLMLWGFFKKIVIADNCAPIVNRVFENYAELGSADLAIGALLFAFQIYGDFSGYSDIAIGLAKLFGFELMQNFKTPYFSRDIAEFWRRWHISLSSWFRDYVYIPLGGSRAGKSIALRNTIIIFLISGFWHGANWTFVVWGAVHAALFVPLLLFQRNRQHLNEIGTGTVMQTAKELVQVLFTFAMVSLAWVFFRSTTITDAFSYLGRLFSAIDPKPISDLVPTFLWIVLVLFVLLEWRARKHGFQQMTSAIKSRPVRWVFYITLVIFIALFGAFEESQFIYFQF